MSYGPPLLPWAEIGHDRLGLLRAGRIVGEHVSAHRFGDHHGKPGKRAGDFVRDVIDKGQVGMAIAAARGRTDGDETFRTFGMG